MKYIATQVNTDDSSEVINIYIYIFIVEPTKLRCNEYFIGNS